MKQLLNTFIILMLFWSFLHSQESYKCYSVLEFTEEGGLEVGDVIWKANRNMYIDSTNILTASLQTRNVLGNRKAEAYFNCIYSFEHLSNDSLIKIHEFELENESLIYLLTDESVQFSYLIFEDRLYLLRDCDSSHYCQSTYYHPVNLIPKQNLVKLFPDDVEIKLDNAIFSTVTEQVLSKESYIEIETEPAVYNVSDKLYFSGVESTCPIDFEYEYVLDSIIVSPEQIILTSYPTTFETFYEQVLEKDAYTLFDTIELGVMDSSFTFVTKPAYKTYFWDIIPNSFSEDPFECLRLDSMFQEQSEFSFNVEYTVNCPIGYDLFGTTCIRQAEVPAEYSTRNYERVAVSSYLESILVPAEYYLFQKQIIPENVEIDDSCISPLYDTTSITTILQPAVVESITHPATYTTRNYEKLVRDSKLETELLQSFEIILNGYDLIENGHTLTQTKICEVLWDYTILDGIESRLINLGYLISSDTTTRTEEYWDAVFRYQIDNGLPFGTINEELLIFLGI